MRSEFDVCLDGGDDPRDLVVSLRKLANEVEKDAEPCSDSECCQEEEESP